MTLKKIWKSYKISLLVNTPNTWLALKNSKIYVLRFLREISEEKIFREIFYIDYFAIFYYSQLQESKIATHFHIYEITQVGWQCEWVHLCLAGKKERISQQQFFHHCTQSNSDISCPKDKLLHPHLSRRSVICAMWWNYARYKHMQAHVNSLLFVPDYSSSHDIKLPFPWNKAWNIHFWFCYLKNKKAIQLGLTCWSTDRSNIL